MARKITTGEVGGAPGGINITNTTLSAANNQDISIVPQGTGILSVNGDALFSTQSDIRFGDADDSNYVAFQAPATIASNVTWTLPDADAVSTGYALVSDGAGTLSWQAAGPAHDDETASATIYYPVISTQTAAGFLTETRTSTTKLSFQPSTGILTVAAITGYAAAVTLTADDTTNATNYPLFSNAATGNVSPRTDTGFTYNPNSGELTAVILTASSDIAVKENIKPLTGAINMVKQLTGYSYTRKSNKSQEIGVLAQDVEKVVPSLVRGSEGNKSVAYGNLVALLIEAFKEQQTEIDELRGKIYSGN